MKYQHILVTRHLINYEEISLVKPIYISYVVISIVLFTSMIAIGYKVFCLSTLEKLMKKFPGGSYIVMKIPPRVPCGGPLLAICYKYNSRNLLGFISTEWAGSTEPGDPYLSRFPDIYSNIYVCPIVCPHLLGSYFNACN